MPLLSVFPCNSPVANAVVETILPLSAYVHLSDHSINGERGEHPTPKAKVAQANQQRGELGFDLLLRPKSTTSWLGHS